MSSRTTMTIFFIVRSESTLLILLYFVFIYSRKSVSKMVSSFYFCSWPGLCSVTSKFYSVFSLLSILLSFFFSEFYSSLLRFLLLFSSSFFLLCSCFKSLALLAALYNLTILMILTSFTILTALVATREALDCEASLLRDQRIHC